MRKSYGFKTFKAAETALYHTLGNLQNLKEPTDSANEANFQSRPMLWAGSPRVSIHRYTVSFATPRWRAISSPEIQGSDMKKAPEHSSAIMSAILPENKRGSATIGLGPPNRSQLLPHQALEHAPEVPLGDRLPAGEHLEVEDVLLDRRG